MIDNTVGQITTEQKIMDAAEKLFLEKGFILSTTTLIAKEAGVTHAMLHYYFRTKEQIFIKVLDKNIGELAGTLRPLMSMERPVWQTIRKGVEVLFDYLNTHRQLPSLIYDVAKHQPRLLDGYVKTSGNALQGAVERHRSMLSQEIAGGRMNDISLKQLVYDIFSMNMSAFMAITGLRDVLHYMPEQIDAFLSEQKREIVNTVYCRLYGEIPA